MIQIGCRPVVFKTTTVDKDQSGIVLSWQLSDVFLEPLLLEPTALVIPIVQFRDVTLLYMQHFRRFRVIRRGSRR